MWYLRETTKNLSDWKSLNTTDNDRESNSGKKEIFQAVLYAK